MKKYVVMFKGGVETQEYFSMQMAERFEELGYEVYWYDLIVSGQSARLLRCFYEEVRAVNSDAKIIIFTFNFNGIAGEDGLYGAEYHSGSFWNDTGLPVYNMVVDHPLYYHKYMHLLPSNYYQISIDRDHVAYMREYFPDVRLWGQDGFLPLGGTELNKNGRIMPDMRYIPMEKRPIDIIFTGNYTPPERFEKYLAHMEPEYREIYHMLAEDAINNTDTLITDLLKMRIADENPTKDELKAIMPNMMYVDLSVRFYYRAKVIAALADSGLKVHTFGAGWNLINCRHPENIITAGSVDSLECLDMISQSKLSINVMPWFKNGAHDRIFNSMLNGAVSVSDTSRYLLEEFKDGENIVFYTLNSIESMAERIAELLKDPDTMQHIADRAYEKCIVSHTWAKRVDKLFG